MEPKCPEILTKNLPVRTAMGGGQPRHFFPRPRILEVLGSPSKQGKMPLGVSVAPINVLLQEPNLLLLFLNSYNPNSARWMSDFASSWSRVKFFQKVDLPGKTLSFHYRSGKCRWTDQLKE